MLGRKIKVAIVINDFLVGGAQNQLTLLIPLLDREKFDLSLITLFEFKDGHTLYKELPEWLPIHKLNFNSFRDIRSWFKLAKILFKIQPDIVMSGLFFSNTVVRILKPFLGYRVIITEHSTYKDKRRMHIILDRILSKMTYKIVAVSRTVARFTSRQESIPENKFEVIYNGVDMGRVDGRLSSFVSREKIKKQLGYSQPDRIVLNVARLTRPKRQDVLIEAFAEFLKRHPQYKLVIVGEGKSRQSLQTLIESLGQQENIFLVGHKDNVLEYYYVSDFFILTSEREGFAIAAIEAMACGIPVVSTKTAGPDEYLTERENGVFIKNLSTKSVVESMEKLLTMDYTSLSSNAKKTSKIFDVTTTANKYANLFIEAVK